MEKLKIGTVCSGIGSPEFALQNLNIPHEIAFACEIDKFPRKSYLQNFKPKLMLTDMTQEKWEGTQFYSDLFIGGIPCQSFSLAGKRLGELDPRGLLFYDFYRYVKNQNPKYFIIENVKGLLSDNKGNTFKNWIDLLGCSENGVPFLFPHPDSLMYNLHWQVLNTKDYDLPQNRERVFLVGIRNDLPNNFVFPAKRILKKRLKHVLEESVHQKYYLTEKMIKYLLSSSRSNQFRPSDGDTIANCITTSVRKMSTQDNYIIGVSRGRNPGNPKSRVAGQEHKQILELNELGITNTISTVQKDNLVIQLNQSKESGGKQPYKQNRVYDAKGLSPALDTECGRCYYLKDFKIRRLTPLECFRLHGYSDEFFYKCAEVNSETQLYKQAGNTISVNVIQAILKNLLLNNYE